MSASRTLFALSDYQDWPALSAAIADFASTKPAVVVASASWCAPCQVLKAKLTDRSHLSDALFESAVWFTFDIDSNADELVKELGIKTIPHVLVVDRGAITQSIKADHLRALKTALQQ